MPDDPVPDAPSTELVPLQRDRVPVTIGVAPATLDEAWRLAQNAAKSGLVPKAYQGKPSDILVAVLMGAEVGMSPMTALQSIGVINGKPGLYGDGLLAVVMASPLYGGHDAYFEVDPDVSQPEDGAVYQRVATVTAADLARDTTRAVCAFRRKNVADRFVASFSVADAKRAELWTKAGTWQTYPQRMLAWRALDFAARAAFPDVLKGLRSLAEVADIPPDPDPATPPPALVVRRKSDALFAGAVLPEDDSV